MEQNDDLFDNFFDLATQPITGAGHLTIKILEELFDKIFSEKYKNQ